MTQSSHHDQLKQQIYSAILSHEKAGKEYENIDNIIKFFTVLLSASATFDLMKTIGYDEKIVKDYFIPIVTFVVLIINTFQLIYKPDQKSRDHYFIYKKLFDVFISIENSSTYSAEKLRSWNSEYISIKASAPLVRESVERASEKKAAQTLSGGQRELSDDDIIPPPPPDGSADAPAARGSADRR